MSIKSSYPTNSPSLVLDFANSRKLDPRITFVRAQTGNIATYMGSDGYVKYAGPDEPRFDHKSIIRENLVTYSEAFNQWGANRLSVTANSIQSPNDTITADKLVEDSTANNTHRISSASISFSSGSTYTHSVYVKAGERKAIAVEFHFQNSGSIWGNAPRARFDVSTGKIGDYNDCTPSITYAGDDWWRCSITATATSSGTNQPGYKLCTDTNAGDEVYDGDGSSGLYLWGAQVEKDSVATDYIKSTSSTATNTRIESKGLLLEKQKTNLCYYSEDFTVNNNSQGWRTGTGFSRATLVANTGIDDPSGGSTASRWSSGTTSANELIYHIAPAAMTIGDTYTASVWIRRVTQTGPVELIIGDLVSHDVSSQLDSVPFGQWVRVTATRTITTTGAVRAYIAVKPNGSSPSTIDIWGYQLEKSEFSTSYIPTTTSTVTRPKEYALIDGISDFFNPNAGSCFVDFEVNYEGIGHWASYERPFAFRDMPSGREFGISTNGTTNQTSVAGYNHYLPGGSYVYKVMAPEIDKIYKIYLGYGDNYVSAYQGDNFYKSNDSSRSEAVLQQPLDNAISSDNHTKLILGGHHTGNYALFGNIRSFTYYPVDIGSVKMRKFV